jgi:hypothetical protein
VLLLMFKLLYKYARHDDATFRIFLVRNIAEIFYAGH